MSKIFIFLLLLVTVNTGYSQNAGSGVNQNRRKEYLMNVYKIHHLKVAAYDKVLSSMKKDNELLKSQVMSSSQYRARQKKLYERYGDQISQIFSKGRYRSWNQLNQNNERYLLLSETKFVSRTKLQDLYKAEVEWETKRNNMLKSSIPQNEKFEQEDAMLKELNNQIIRILGSTDGEWYINIKKDHLNTLANMDKYGASYKEALTITKIEEDHSKLKASVFSKRKRAADKELDLINNEQEKERRVFSEISSPVAARWKKVNENSLDHMLGRKYGLNMAQIADFKKAYNRYAIKEHNVLKQKTLSDADKYSQISGISTTFQQEVRPFFQPADYLKWQGWWQYDFKRRMARKGFL